METSRFSICGAIMRLMVRHVRPLSVAALAAFSAAPALAATCTSAITGNWNTAATWSGCGSGVPAAGDTAIIANGHTVTANANTTVGAVTVNTGGTLNVDSSNWTVNGATNISGTLAHTSAGGNATFIGAVTVNSGGTWNNSANEAVNFRGGIVNNGTWTNGTATQTFNTNSQVIAGANPITFGGAVTITGAITLTNNNTDIVTINGALDGSANGSTWVNGVNATLNYANTTRPFNGRGALNAGANPNTVNYSLAGNQAVFSTTYHNLVLSGSGTKTLPGALTIGGDFSMSGTAATTAAGAITVGGNFGLAAGSSFNAGAFTHTLSGNFNNSGTFSPSTSTFIFGGGGPQAVTGVTAFGSVTIANTSAPFSVNSNISATGTFAVNAGATLIPAAGIVISGSGTLNGNGTVRVTRTVATADFSSQYTVTNKTLANLTVEYVGSAAQTVSALTYGNVVIGNASGVVLASGVTTVGGTLTLSSGTLAVGGSTLVLNGPVIAGTPANLSATTSSSISFGGSAAGVSLPASVTQVNNLTVNNTNGLTLNGGVTVNGTLTLTNGTITTNSNTLSASVNNCPSSIARTNGYINGSLRLKFGIGSNTCTFPVGSSTAYAPITVTTPTLSSGGLLTGSTVGAEHPQISDSTIDATKDVNRYWNLSGDTINASSYAVTVNFVVGDIDVGASTGNFVLGKYEAGTWSAPTPVVTGSTSTGSTNVPGPLTNSSFAAGESTFVCSVPAGMPSTMTCVCDNFGRATLNPSTIYGGNWAVSSSSGSFGVPRIVNSGYLQMTNNSTDVATAATMPGTFPAAGNLIVVDFKHYAYNGSGADGVALTLSDATVPPLPGAYGGSLGFAQKNNASCASPPCNGFSGGWVGIGIDEFGNYSNPTEGRSGGPGSRPDAVAVRGSGSGLTGFPYMGGTATLNPGIDNPGSTSSSPGHAYRIMVDARCYERNTNNSDIVCNNAALAKKSQVTVFRDTTGAGNFVAGNKVVDFDAYAVNAAQANVPANWKLSFTGSTGGNTNIHEIQGLKICAQTITPPAGYRIQVDNLTPSTCATPGGSPSSPIVTISALDTNGNIITTYDKTVNLSALLPNGSNSSATWRKVGGASNITQYTFTAGDNGVAQFYLTDANPESISITIGENGGTISSSFGTPVVYSGASFNITNIDALGGGLGGGVVAGRNHLMRITRTNGCSVNTAYTGTKNLDGWYTPATPDHPTGASAPQICAPNASGTCLPSTGACQTLSIAPPTIDSGSNFMPPLDFVNGVASFCVATSDVGKFSVSLRDDTATPVTGSSNTLTARPFAVVVRDVKGTNDNPADASSGGGMIGNAGANFQATVAGYLWNSTGDANGDGLPDAGTNLAQVTGAGIAPRYADSVGVSAIAPFSPVPASGGPFAGVLSGGPVLVSGGSTNSLSLAYSEVGTFSLSAAPSANYLNSGINLSNRVAIFAKPGDQSRTALVGRFKPDHFTISGGFLTNRSGSSCSPNSAFTYMGEPMRVGFTLEARNFNGDQTRNYAGNWAKLSTQDWISYNVNNSVGLWMVATGYPVSPGACKAVFGPAAGVNTTFICDPGVTAPSPLTRTAGPRVAMSAQPAVPAWNNGAAALAADVTLHRADLPDGPYATLNIGVMPRDSEGTTLKPGSLNLDADSASGNERFSVASTSVRFGRLRMFNAVGSEKMPLPIPIQAEFWNGTSFQVNALDNCTSFVQNNFAISYTAGGINGSNMPLSNLVVGGIVNGVGSLRLNRPTSPPASKGSAILCLDLGPDTAPGPTCAATTALAMPWLQGRWSTQPDFDDDPTIRATFGVYRGGPIIYMREMY